MTLPKDFELQGGKYRIIRFISAGGFGCTYEALMTTLNRRVAIKEFFIKDFCNRDETDYSISVATKSKEPLVKKLRGKFLAEARAVAELSHPGIVSVIDVFEQNGTAYFVMDYIDGMSLAQMVKSGPLPEAKAVGYIKHVCDALGYVHSRNRLHLDIKPGNIMVDKYDRILLIDFGASKQYDEESGENSSSITGRTPGYAPLEQIGDGLVKFSPATDIYSVGATLYKLLTGITPPESNYLASGDKELKPLPPKISPNVCSAVYAAMAIPRSKRPQSVAEFLQLLDPEESAVVQGEVSSDDISVIEEHTPVPQPEIVDTPIKPEPDCHDQDDLQEEVMPSATNKTWLIPSLIAGGLVMCILFVLLVTTKPDAEPQTKDLDVYAQSDTETASEDISTGSLNDAYAQSDTETTNEYAPTGRHNGHDYVDLGLSVKWATCNVGTKRPYDYGDYFAWGETRAKAEFIGANSDWEGVCYKDLRSRGVIDSKGNLTRQYDAAAAKWGSSWRMPTKEEMLEIIDKCTWIWTNLYGKLGYTVKGPNGNALFLPAAGYQDDSSFDFESLFGSYWSSTAYDGSYAAYLLEFNSSHHDLGYNFRWMGRTIRPVIE